MRAATKQLANIVRVGANIKALAAQHAEIDFRQSNPVAMGSSVPQWPIFLNPSCRRVSATTSCDVMPSALSTKRTPSGIATDDITNFLQNFSFDFRERAADARTGGENMSAATKFFADGAHVYLFAF